MTILGYQIASEHRATVWTDSETYGADHAPTGHVSKMAVNPLAVSVLVGTGYVWVLKRARECFVDCKTFNEALLELPNVLRGAVQGMERERLRPTPLQNSVCVVGFCHRSRRMAGFVLDEASMFEPTPVREVVMPHVEAPLCDDAHSVISTAQRQVAALKLPVSGTLLLGRLEPTGVSVSQVFDLGRGQQLRRPLDLTQFEG